MAVYNIPDSLNLPKDEVDAFIRFLQQMTNRRAAGWPRYGRSDKRKRYMTRMELEVKAYRRTGNKEQLLNIAVYAFLESFAPENGKFHHNDLAESVTRMKLGGERVVREGD